MAKKGISACIMVKNEEKNLPELLKNLEGVVDELVVIDHESTDNTEKILENAGAKIIPQTDPERLKGKNWVDVERVLLNQNANQEWILHIDADERLTERTREELPKIAQQNDYDVIWLISKHFYAPGKWFKHGFYHPHPEPRFYRRSCKTNWSVKIHEPPQIEGKQFYSDLDYDHIYYTAGDKRIAEKHESYIKVEREQKKEYLSKNMLVKWFFIILGYPVYFFYGLFRWMAFLDGWRGVTTNYFLAQYFARSGYLEVFVKKKLGLIKTNPFLDKNYGKEAPK